MIEEALTNENMYRILIYNMSRKIDFTKEMEKRAPQWEALDPYVSARTKIRLRHKPCGTVVVRTTSQLFSAPDSCRECARKRSMLSEEEFLKRVEKKKDYKVIGKYNGYYKDVEIKHLVCGNTFCQWPSNFMKREEGCPFCKKALLSKKKKKTHDQFVAEVEKKLPGYEVLSQYKSAHEKVLVRHACGEEWWIPADSLLRGGGCKRCKASAGELEMRDFVEKAFDGEVRHSVRTILPGKKELDIYIPALSIAIEYDGLRYHTVEHFLEDKNRNWTYAQAAAYHKKKTDECLSLGIRLIHVFEDEWREHREIVEDKIKSALKLPCERVYARKTTVARISAGVAEAFLNKNHIQGAWGCTICYGLYLGDDLVAVQAFSKARGGGGWTLSRYATKLGVQVVGGFSKCLKAFENEVSPKLVESFADLRWTSQEENVYISNGFEEAGRPSPTYYYVKGLKREHKFKYRKKAIAKKFPNVYSPSKTEKEMMREAGYNRIYDCGMIKYVKKYGV